MAMRCFQVSPSTFLSLSLSTPMESSSPSNLDYLILILLRPILAVLFVFSFIIIGWVLAWKLVLVHVPLVQEICKSLRKKPVKTKPLTGRLSRFYDGAPSDF
ncbi:hypothetical protein GIB67_017868 [Kingdonia uniflora]|uniref:Transmembrane protein n=1 Tax=Kingdonia uniflora TaxID=39325 RepID=A0A7J7MKV1_9MAGN|nr:hypothetical protein GIB67_017868 [Kingdonia uniflora]